MGCWDDERGGARELVSRSEGGERSRKGEEKKEWREGYRKRERGDECREYEIN